MPTGIISRVESERLGAVEGLQFDLHVNIGYLQMIRRCQQSLPRLLTLPLLSQAGTFISAREYAKSNKASKAASTAGEGKKSIGGRLEKKPEALDIQPKAPALDVARFSELADAGHVSQCERLFATSSQTQEASDLLLEVYLRYGMLKKALALPASTSTVSVNAWMRFWIDYGQPERASSLFEAHLDRLNQESYLIFISDALHNGLYENADKYKHGMIAAGFGVDATAYYDAVVEDLCRKRIEAKNFLRGGMSANVYNCFLEAFSAVNDHRSIERTQHLMQAQSLAMTVDSYNALLLGMASYIQDAEMEAILKQMIQQDIEADSGTHYAVVKSMLMQRKFDSAFILLDSLIQSKRPLKPEHIVELVRFCVVNEYDCVIGLLKEMVAKSAISMPVEYYIQSIKLAIGTRKFSSVHSILLEMQSQDVQPSVRLLNELLGHCIEVMDMPRAQQLLVLMAQHGLQHTSETKNTLLKAFHLCIRPDEGSFVLRGFPVDNSSGQILTEMPDKPVKWQVDGKGTLKLNALKASFEGIFKMPLYVGTNLFNDLLVSMLRSTLMHDFHRLLAEMRAQQVSPNQATLTLAIKACIYSHQPELSKAMIEEFKRWGITPSLIQCAIIHHYYCRHKKISEAEAWMDRVQQRYAIRPNVVFYGSLIYAYFRVRNFQAVMEVRDRMLNAGFTPDTEASNYIMCSLFESGMHNAAVDYFRHNAWPRKNQHTYTIYSYNLMYRSKFDEFFTGVHDCIELNNLITHRAFEPVFIQALKEGRSDIIRMVVMRMVEYVVQFDKDVMAYVEQVFNLLLSEALGHQQPSEMLLGMTAEQAARCLVEKALIDVSPEDKTVERMCSALSHHYHNTGNVEGAASLDAYLRDRLPLLRRLWTELKPDFIETMHEIEECRREIHSDLYLAAGETEADGDELIGNLKHDFLQSRLDEEAVDAPTNCKLPFLSDGPAKEVSIETAHVIVV